MKSIVMPPYTFEGPRHKIPFRRHVIASATIDNIVVELISNHGETQWWLLAHFKGGGVFAQPSNGLTTRSAAKAAQWLEAIEAGRIEFAE